MKTLTKIATLILVCFNVTLHAQNKETDPGWQCGKLSNTYNFSSCRDIKTDFSNNTFTCYFYRESITIEDTTFCHPDGDPNTLSYTIVKRNPDGGFLKAVDIYTEAGENLFDAYMVLDKESNIYLYGTFTDTLFVNGHYVTLPHPNHVDIYLLKLDNNFEFQWAQTISSLYQDICSGITISDDNHIYLSVEHLTGGHNIANYFNQDSADVFGGLGSLLKIDTDGQIIWRSEIKDGNNASGRVENTVMGEDGNIYLRGYSSGDVVIQGDTIKYPTFTGYLNTPYLVQFDQNGYHHNAFFETFDFSISYQWFNVDKDGNFCFSAMTYDTLIFGSDTIHFTGDSLYAFVAKMDPLFQPIWQRGIKTDFYSDISFQSGLIENSLAFAFHGYSRFFFMGKEYTILGAGQVFLGLFSPDGELVNLQMTDASIGATLNMSSLDNCTNYIIEGQIRGLAHFGRDTLDAGYNYHPYIAKNFRIHPLSLDMPADTANCGPVILYAPEGHLYYKWNDELSDQNWFQVDTTGIVNLKVADESCCWSEAETRVTIYTPVQFSLGADTTIRLTDTLRLVIAGEYKSYLWSTGDTTPVLILPATELQIGNNQIWLNVENDYCSGSDTVIVRVVDNSTITETEPYNVSFYPNPAYTSLQIIIEGGKLPECVTFYDQEGNNLLKLKPVNNLINISGLKSGIYIVELVFNHGIVTRKLVVL